MVRLRFETLTLNIGIGDEHSFQDASVDLALRVFCEVKALDDKGQLLLGVLGNLVRQKSSDFWKFDKF